MVENFSKMARGVRPGARGTGEVLQGDEQAIGEERDEDMRLDPLFALMKDWADGKVMLEYLERLLDLR